MIDSLTSTRRAESIKNRYRLAVSSLEKRAKHLASIANLMSPKHARSSQRHLPMKSLLSSHLLMKKLSSPGRLLDRYIRCKPAESNPFVRLLCHCPRRRDKWSEDLYKSFPNSPRSQIAFYRKGTDRHCDPDGIYTLPAENAASINQECEQRAMSGPRILSCSIHNAKVVPHPSVWSRI